MEFKAQIEEATPELRLGDVMVIEWHGDFATGLDAYLCVRVPRTSDIPHERVALQNLNGSGRSFLSNNVSGLMANVERQRKHGKLSYKHYSQDDYMMVAIEKKKEGAQ
ncbi:hypothetical protein P4261_28070 [Bacillus thuringiensis]|nr:hypothetical protein [Bacillus thuringiensis]MED2829739.1 hypothetical protein [Bacillus thuringiensis]MED2856400.1 hypothetical protein [Bacillus thuringiensis]MED2863795.1 hypothetical protein [Bacillus thuringiensis]